MLPPRTSLLRWSRRRALAMAAAGAALLHLRNLAATVLSPSRAPAPALEALGPFLDTLIPADHSPSATGAGVDRRLRRLAGRSARHLQLLEAGCRWLDRAAVARGATDFAALDAAGREAVVAGMSAGTPGSPERQFFDRVRGSAMRYYYAEPAVWKSMGYAGPPQPVGFPDHAEPPSGDRG